MDFSVRARLVFFAGERAELLAFARSASRRRRRRRRRRRQSSLTEMVRYRQYEGREGERELISNPRYNTTSHHRMMISALRWAALM